jgi:hypothetical protein
MIREPPKRHCDNIIRIGSAIWTTTHLGIDDGVSVRIGVFHRGVIELPVVKYAGAIRLLLEKPTNGVGALLGRFQLPSSEELI